MVPTHPLLLAIFFLLSATSSSANVLNSTITLHLRPLAAHRPSPDQWEEVEALADLSASSLARARHLKRPKKANFSSSFTASAADDSSPVDLPLSSHSYGGYTVDLSFGTPPQTMTFVMDTGSSLVWSPCTSHYKCSRCSFPTVNPSNLSVFIPRASSSSKIIGCRNPKCQWIFGRDIASQCPTSQVCPPYILQYGSGSTGGLLLSESLDLPGRTVPNFLLGCSVFSSAQPAGIAGFGRGSQSLPAQLRIKRFSHCLLSRNFDDSPQTSNLVLNTVSGGRKTKGLSYTPFRENPSSPAAFSEYYYVGLRKITVGGKAVKVPHHYLVPESEGNGGTIVDSGTTFTFMERPIFEAVAKEFDRQMGSHRRAVEVERRSGLRPCYDVSDRSPDGSLELPELVFYFKGGAKMALPGENYFALLKSGVICLTIISDSVMVGPDARGGGGPAVVLGSFQQQNYQVEYDLENNRLGFMRQICR
ncbi:hypothetical protein SAY86_031178 [Trapa natans]|uniref:Peptidase A1 domain-containing protein n=1 Tax=Trapa natans TaxID=22666 RepID=A0AAN7M6A1_TRANT|nr:hypothetical protein SAY86_031178 [Trapa natans]